MKTEGNYRLYRPQTRGKMQTEGKLQTIQTVDIR